MSQVGLLCANEHCNYLVTAAEFGGFCCKRCYSNHVRYEIRCTHAQGHGQKCELRQPKVNTARAEPTQPQDPLPPEATSKAAQKLSARAELKDHRCATCKLSSETRPLSSSSAGRVTESYKSLGEDATKKHEQRFGDRDRMPGKRSKRPISEDDSLSEKGQATEDAKRTAWTTSGGNQASRIPASHTSSAPLARREAKAYSEDETEEQVQKGESAKRRRTSHSVRMPARRKASAYSEEDTESDTCKVPKEKHKPPWREVQRYSEEDAESQRRNAPKAPPKPPWWAPKTQPRHEEATGGRTAARSRSPLPRLRPEGSRRPPDAQPDAWEAPKPATKTKEKGAPPSSYETTEDDEKVAAEALSARAGISTAEVEQFTGLRFEPEGRTAITQQYERTAGRVRRKAKGPKPCSAADLRFFARCTPEQGSRKLREKPMEADALWLTTRDPSQPHAHLCICRRCMSQFKT